MPFLSISDGESFAGWSKNSPIEKAVRDRRHTIIKKLRHQVITFTAKRENGIKKPTQQRLYEYRDPVRANRQLAVVLREQGLNEEADHFAYRAQQLQRIVLRLQGLLPEVKLLQRVQKLSGYVWSGILDGLAGYGYKPVRTLGWYLLVIFWFAWIYFHLGPIEGHPFSFIGALVFSVTSFHGRGFFPGGLSLEAAITQFQR